jgi:hypothetical protein
MLKMYIYKRGYQEEKIQFRISRDKAKISLLYYNSYKEHILIMISIFMNSI